MANAPTVRTIVRTEEAPISAAPLSQAIIVDKLVFCSGVVGIDKNTGQLAPGGTAAEAHQAL